MADSRTLWDRCGAYTPPPPRHIQAWLFEIAATFGVIRTRQGGRVRVLFPRRPIPPRGSEEEGSFIFKMQLDTDGIV